MTDREKLTELIYESDLVCNKTLCEECDYLCSNRCKASMTADHLLANGVTFQKWIPVSERLPEDDRQVLACTKKGKAFSAHYDHRWKSWSVSHTVKITHWMPLPEPPKEE